MFELLVMNTMTYRPFHCIGCANSAHAEHEYEYEYEMSRIHGRSFSAGYMKMSALAVMYIMMYT